VQAVRSVVDDAREAIFRTLEDRQLADTRLGPLAVFVVVSCRR